jgi:geranylgeranyl diphosphate synthase type II
LCAEAGIGRIRRFRAQRDPSPSVQPHPVAQEGEPEPSDEGLRERVDRALEEWIQERELPANLRAACLYALGGGGKRVRPLLALRSARAAGGEFEDALDLAVALELVHCFSLVHDDLPALDDDDLRRGRPTLHRHAGEAMAILTGDALFGLAFERLAREGGDPAIRLALLRELAIASDDMIAGQVHDSLPDFPAGLPALERLETIHRQKTRALIRCACRGGALAGGASGALLERLTRYGEAIGLMFQIVDDLLDVTQTTEHLGKTAHKDAAQGKLTYPGLLGVEASRAEVERLRREAQDALSALGPRAEPLRQACTALATRTR